MKILETSPLQLSIPPYIPTAQNPAEARNSRPTPPLLLLPLPRHRTEFPYPGHQAKEPAQHSTRKNTLSGQDYSK